MNNSDDVDVAIVGAGPVGLYLATDLARRGVSVRMIDRARTPVRHSRASVVWPRQLELLHAIGATEELLERGRAIEGVAFHSDRRDLGELRFATLRETPFPFGLAVSQEVTERVLANRYEALLGPLRRDCELRALAQDDRGVDLTIRSDAGESRLRARWVVGADGARSTVRELSGIAFPGPDGTARFGIGDAAVEGALSTRMLHYFYSGSAAIAVSPFTAETMRIAVSLAPGAPNPDRAFFRDALTTHTRLVTDVLEPDWATAFDVRFRTAERFRAGRVLLAGDAAHIVSPAGGQGMNTGLQDAANLGWKLAHVLRAGASEALLDSYDAERRWAAGRAAETSGRMARWAGVRGRGASRRRDAEVARATRGRRGRLLAEAIAQVDTHYPASLTPGIERADTAPGADTGTGAEHPRVGARFPSLADPAPNRAPWSGWPTHDALTYTLFLWPGGIDPRTWRRIVEDIAAHGRHAVRDLARAASPESGLRRRGRGSYVLVRPDGHVAAAGALTGAGELPEAVLGPSPHRARPRAPGTRPRAA